MSARLLLPLLCCFILSAAEGWSPVPGVTVLPDGRLQAGGITAELQLFAPGGMSMARQALRGRGAVDQGRWALDAPWQSPAGELRLGQGVQAADGVLTFSARLAGEPQVESFALGLTLPGGRHRGGEIRIDGAVQELPGTSPKPLLRAPAPARLVEIPAEGGGWLVLSGDLRVLVQDESRWNNDAFTVRVLAGPARDLAVSLRLRPAAPVAPLDLGAAAATPLRDEVAGDGAGGWTDQGDNDLRRLPPGALNAAGIPFTVGARAAVLADGRVAWLPRSAAVEAGGRQGACLYLLHASAWTPAAGTVVGRLTLRFRDGSAEERTVTAGREVANWWTPPERVGAARLGWCADNGHALVGLFVARLAIPERPLERIELAAAGGAVWMVVGLALGGDQPLAAAQPDVVQAGPRWLAAGPVPWEVEPGSALDLAALTAAPLPGRLEARGPHLALAGGAPVRLLGANLCFSANYPAPATAERLAAGLRAMGHNALRIHHHDGLLVKAGGDGGELDPERLDRLDRLVAACKRQGLWITTDLYVSRQLPKGLFPELPEARELKALIPLLPAALDNWKRFATALLTHRNPHTGLTWAEEPALATISLVNEDNISGEWRRDARVQALYEQRFAAWLAARPEPERSAAGAERGALFARWLCGLQTAAYAAMREHLRALGVVAPTTGLNWKGDWWSLAARDGLDLIDNHAYFDHPGFPGQPFRLPMTYSQRSAVEDLLRVPTGIAHTRRLDKPFTVSEINYCPPNHRRAEYAAGVAAVAGLQDWSGLWRFAFAHRIELIEQGGPVAGFDIAGDPIGLLGERAVALLYRRGDVEPAPWSAALTYDPAQAAGDLAAQPPAELALLALHARTGCLPLGAPPPADVRCLVDGGRGAPAGATLPMLAAGPSLLPALGGRGWLPAGACDPAAKRVRSASGQIDCDGARGVLTVATRRSVAAVLPGNAQAAPGGIAIANRDADPATVVVAAVDALPLAESRRLLVLHLTDAQNTGARFASARHTLLEDHGAGPLLVRAGALRLDLPAAVGLRAYALDLRGTRREEVAFTGGGLDLAVARPWGPCLAWELVRE